LYSEELAALELTTELTYVKGVGPARAQFLEAKGLKTVRDLLEYPPFRYEDRTNVKTISQLAPGEMATVLVEVRSAKHVTMRRRNLGLFEAVFGDNSPRKLVGKWFQGGYLQEILTPGKRVALFGKVEFDTYSSQLGMMHPDYEILSADDEDPDLSLHTGRVVPIYEAAGKVSARLFRRILRNILDRLSPEPDTLPGGVIEKHQLMARWPALNQVHFPSPDSDLRLLNQFRSPAHWRMIFEEFFWLEFGLHLKKTKARQRPGIAFQLTDQVRSQLKKMLPFHPTGAQKRVLGEIARDMAEPHPMSRLVQGDVGSGKTLVAAESAVIAIENGYQVAMVAPTEILAAQHHLYLKKLFDPLGYVVAPLVGSMTPREKMKVKEMLALGLIQVAVGTHALMEENVDFRRLGLVIIDEQHRFGVRQRMSLMQKGVHPDVLVMTATPIPRTLALTIYGDLDTSLIDELPPGRKPIVTQHFEEERIEQVWSFLKREIEAGRQAYVVYPVIEESETAAMKAAEKMHQHLSRIVFPQFGVALLHGRMSADDKQAVMDGFKKNLTQILVATTVIEVGVDVPNATVMVIEQAERFGLAQLHQLRGRVGRGGGQSYCFLVTGKMTETGRERIRTMVESSDGFKIAEMDLKLRGPGEFFGTKQSGLPELHFANLLRDQDLLILARDAAAEFVKSPPGEREYQRAFEYLEKIWQPRYGMIEVG
jgi:ATP-dependent DNA helicase RecG